MDKDLQCPYCGVEADVCHDDGFYEEDFLHEMECGFCGKTFTFNTIIAISYEAHKADCLNEGEHIWEPTTTYPIECTKMGCKTCEETRNPTKEEWKLINIKK